MLVGLLRALDLRTGRRQLAAALPSRGRRARRFSSGFHHCGPNRAHPFDVCASRFGGTRRTPLLNWCFSFHGLVRFQQQWDSAPERSRHPARASSLIAKQIDPSILPQRVPQPLAFLQASVLQERTSSRATWICVALVSPIRKQAVQKAAVFAWEVQVFRGQRLLPAHVFSR